MDFSSYIGQPYSQKLINEIKKKTGYEFVNVQCLDWGFPKTETSTGGRLNVVLSDIEVVIDIFVG